ncbi:hypothetical protein [Streptomyces venezuelae]|uniref:hypothetical protein n=1 Tax=Streptomyces venezuelae TaxID=54571 RepID=UPI00362C5992
MSQYPRSDTSAPRPEELRKAVAHTREKLGQTVEALAAKAPDPAVDKAAHAAAQVRSTAARAGRLAAERTPDLVADKVGQGASAARAYRTPLLVGVAALGVLLLVRRSRRHR